MSICIKHKQSDWWSFLKLLSVCLKRMTSFSEIVMAYKCHRHFTLAFSLFLAIHQFSPSDRVIFTLVCFKWLLIGQSVRDQLSDRLEQSDFRTSFGTNP